MTDGAQASLTDVGELPFQPWSRLRRSAVIAFDGALALGTGAVAGLVGTGSASPMPASPGWSPLQSPAPSGPDAQAANPGTYLVDEACTSAVFCAAVGFYSDSGGHEHGLLDTLSGVSWSATEAPLPANAGPNPGAFFDSVSCPTQGSCVAVGAYKDASNSKWGVIDTLSGGHWTTMETPLPADAATGSNEQSWLKSVSCPTIGSCTAVGYYHNASTNSFGLVDTLSGGQWTAATAPQPSDAATNQSVALVSVSCPAQNNCVAIGSFTNSGSNGQAELLRQSGGAWVALPAPIPPNNDGSGRGELNGLSCAGGTCQAVGEYHDTAGKWRGLLERLAGGSWTATEAPEPSSNGGTGADQNANLNSVSCTFDGGCTAVGYYEDSSAEYRGLIDTMVAGVPTAHEAAQPPDFGSGTHQSTELRSVSCLSIGECTAVGNYENSTGSGNVIGLIDTESGDSWSALAAPRANDAATGASEYSDLYSVSCTSRGACDAAGIYVNTGPAEFGLLESFTPNPGYWLVAGDGGIFTHGSAQFEGSQGATVLNKPIVGMATTPGDPGYWLVASDGGIFTHGDAQFYGSEGATHLNKPIVGMAATPDGGGYWLVASDGGIFTHGDAQFYGSEGGTVLNKPIVGMAATPSGLGYWLVASDGGIFTHGDAQFEGSEGATHLNKPIVGMMSTFDGGGYWLVASDGGIFTHGDAQFEGSEGATVLNSPVVGGAPS